MNVAELMERLNAERKSLETEISEFNGSIHYRWPRKGWERVSRVTADRPLDIHLKTLEWVERHA